MARRRNSLAARETRLAYGMLAPTLLVVFAIVLVPVILALWISLKPVTLADLRAPAPVVNERVLDQAEEPGDPFTLRLTMRNSSQSSDLLEVAWSKALPAGVTYADDEPRCFHRGDRLHCDFGTWEAGYRETLVLALQADARYFEAGAPDLRAADTTVRARADHILTNFSFTLDNYRRIFAASDFWTSLRITLTYTFFSSLGSILLGLFAAQLLDRPFLGRGFLRGLFLFPYVAPVIAVAFVWAFFLDPFSGTVNALGQRFELIGEPINFLGQRAMQVSLFGLAFDLPVALLTVIAFSSWNYFPFAFLFLLARLQAIPVALYESADVDGAGPFHKFLYITLPNLAGVLAVLFLLRFMFLINKFEDIFLLTGGAAGTKNLPVMVYDEAFARADIGAGAAVAIVLFLVLMIFLVAYYRLAPESER